MDCIFCKIIAGEIPATKVYEDEGVVAFLDISANSRGHTLVVPKQHIRNILEMDDATCTDLFVKVKKIAVAIKNNLNADGLNIAMNNEKSAGQIVFHAHVHIIPRYAGVNEIFNRTKYTYKEGEMEEIANGLRVKF
ncbi:MAG: HIT family protein [Candidatus Paceibacterota bacterium]|jgi:histidine triad (HIT) family protein